MELAGYDELRREQAEKRDRGELMGIGVSFFTEGGAARSGRSVRSGARRRRPPQSMPWWSAWWTASHAGCGQRAASAAPSCSALRFDDFSRATRSHTLPHATAQTQVILDTARALLATVMPMIEREGLTLVGVAVANLDNAATVQLGLPFGPHGSDALDAALDEVRDRFGTAAITRAVLLGRDPGWTMPLLPD